MVTTKGRSFNDSDSTSSEEGEQTTATTKFESNFAGAVVYALDTMLELRYFQIERDAFTTFSFHCNSEQGVFATNILVREDPPLVVLIMKSPTMIPEAQRMRVAEFITRARFAMLVGGFEMDFLDGDLHFRIGLPLCGGAVMTPELLVNTFAISLECMNRYVPGIMKVTYANVDPEAAVREVANAAENVLGTI